MSKYEEDFYITSHDVDLNNQLMPTVIARLMQEAGNHQMRDRKPTYYELLDDRKTFIVVRFAMEILKPVGRYSTVTLRTWKCKSRGATFVRSFDLLYKGEVAVKANSQWAIVDMDSKKILKTTDVDLSNYETDEEYILSFPIRFRLSDDLEFSKVGEAKVVYSNIDENMHMNNTYYQNLIWNYVEKPEAKRLLSTNIRFMKEAYYGATIEIFRAEEKDEDGDEKTYYFYTLVDGEKNIEAVVKAKDLHKEW